MLRNLELPKQHRYCSLYFWHLLTEHFFSFHRSNKKYDYLRHKDKDKELDDLIKCNVNAPWWILTEAVVMSHWLVKKINKMQNDHHSLFSPKKEMEAIRRNQSTREQRVRRHVLIHRQLLVAQTQSRTSTSPADVERRCTFFSSSSHTPTSTPASPHSHFLPSSTLPLTVSIAWDSGLNYYTA